MPDGSRDMYVGLGVQSAPRYQGTGSRKVSALPVLQVQWSNGIFVSGMSAGMHLSDSPTLEYGPLLAVLPGRDETGSRIGLGSVGDTTNFTVAIPAVAKSVLARNGRLGGMDEIGTRLQVGAFANYYLNPAWRLTASALLGSGKDHDGARLELGVQRLAAAIGERHRVSLAAGVTLVNRQDNATWFGVTRQEAARSRFARYQPGGGVQDVHLGARWNWAWTPSWMLTSNLEGRRLLGSADKSPLAERSANLTVSTAIAYRF
jgi:outer membrane scaffolding protein for murein synthesis (MipA/OmpV family)